MNKYYSSEKSSRSCTFFGFLAYFFCIFETFSDNDFENPIFFFTQNNWVTHTTITKGGNILWRSTQQYLGGEHYFSPYFKKDLFPLKTK